MGIGETHASPRKLIKVRRRDLRIPVVATEVAVPEIVGEDQHNIWLLHRTGLSHLANQTQRNCQP